MEFMAFGSDLMFVLWAVLLLFKVWVFVGAADKLTKPAWATILGVSAAAELVLPGPIGFVSILGTVASLVYLVDVRPALAQVTGPRR